MNSYEFVEAIKLAVKDDCTKGLLRLLTKPAGRKPPIEFLRMSEWHNNLSDNDKEMLEKIMNKAIDTAIFGFFCVLDGVRAIENEDKGVLELYYVKDNERVLLNDLNNELLHDIYQGITQD